MTPDAWLPCPVCGGTGDLRARGGAIVTCHRCDGDGEINDPHETEEEDQ